jgi:predicted sulfurtransferase
MVYLQFQKPDTTTNTSSITNTQMTNQNISQISLEEFKTELLDEDVILIDVRSAQEQATY